MRSIQPHPVDGSSPGPWPCSMLAPPGSSRGNSSPRETLARNCPQSPREGAPWRQPGRGTPDVPAVKARLDIDKARLEACKGRSLRG